MRRLKPIAVDIELNNVRETWKRNIELMFLNRPPVKTGTGSIRLEIRDYIFRIRALDTLRAELKQYRDRLTCQFHPHIELNIAEVTPCPNCNAECTGISAVWCPNCGDCSCPANEEGERSMNEINCPLHGVHSKHALEDEWAATSKNATVTKL